MEKHENLPWKRWLPVLAAVCAFILWHGQEVKAGAAASGDGWLMGGYLILAAALFFGLLAAMALFYKRNNRTGRKRWSLEQIYLPVGFFLGLAYLFVLPPLSAPDEVSHYISAYQLSSHMLGKEANYRTGHVLVRGNDWFLEDTHGTYGYEVDEDEILTVLDAAPEEREGIVLGQNLSEETYRQIYEKGILGKKTPQEEAWEENRGEGSMAAQTAVSPYPPVVTTPLAYVPQALGISLARVLHLNSIWLAYMGRLCNLLFFVAVTALAMKRLPFGKEVLFGVALLPMTLHLSASFSYDVMIMGCMFYFTAVCLDLAFRKEKVEKRDVAVLMVLMAMAGPCKMVYAVMMGLCLLIPVKKFGGWTRWAVSAVCVAGIWAAAMVLVNRQTIVSYASATEQVVPWAEEAGYSLYFLIHNPGTLIQMIYNTLLWQAENCHMTMIGAYLGNLDQGLDVPYPAVICFTCCLLGLALKKPGESVRLTGAGRVWTWVVCAGCAMAILLSMLIAWTPVSSHVISGVQGRYFLPFLPVLLIALKNDWLILTKDRNRSILYLMFCLNGYVLIRLFATVCMRV